MLALLWVVRIYRWWMIAWVLMTWIPGLSGSTFHYLLGIPIIPVIAPLDFLSVGAIGFGPIIPLLALWYIEQWLAGLAGETEPQEEYPAAEPEYGEPEPERWDAEGRVIDARRGE